MGVSIEVYRCRIGTFQSKSVLVAGKNTCSSISSKTSSSIFIFFTILLSCSVILAHSVHTSRSIQFNIKLEKYPSGSAWNPSSGQTGGLPSPTWCPPAWIPPWPPPTYPNPHLPSQSHDITPSQHWYSALISIQTQDQLANSRSTSPNVYNFVQEGITGSAGSSHLLSTPNTPSSWLTRAERNSIMRSIHGNRGQRGKGIKIVAWNKGSSLLHNKHQEIETIIAGHQPHILGLSEANLRSNADLTLVQHADYQLHTAPTLTNPDLGISRVVVYTHSSLVVKRRPDLEDDTLSAIWLEVGMPRQKKILVANVYREWKFMNQGENNDSGSIPAQLERWCKFLTKWEAALAEGKEVMVLGDVNIDFLKWTRTDLPQTDQAVKLRTLTDQLFSRIFPHGVAQLVQVATRVWPGVQDSGLDHIYSNKPEKCSDIYVEFRGGSDHKLLRVTRFTKSMKNSARYVRKRSFKNFNQTEFCEAVKKISWFDLYTCEDPSQAAALLTSKLTDILDQMAPIKTFQVRTKYAPWMSQNTKELLKERNLAQETAA